MSQHGSREPLPIILIRGFGGINTQDEIADTHQGFNTGTVYPHRTGENYIYEGMILRFLKSMWGYVDATNVVGFYADGTRPQGTDDSDGAGYTSDILTQIDQGYLPWLKNPKHAKKRIKFWQQQGYLTGSVMLDAKGALDLLMGPHPERSLWIYRYYDLNSRFMKNYGQQLSKLINIICDVTGAEQVNIIAHSMGGLIARALIQDPSDAFKAERARINKLVTLGTPHKGISFQYLPDLFLTNLLRLADELNVFNPKEQQDADNAYGYTKFRERFDLERTLCVVGTNYRTYDNRLASLLNRLFSVDGDGGLLYNKSDGLVKQKYAALDGAYIAYVHKCHGGRDSVVNSREAYEIANRFFFGDRLVRLYFLEGEVKKKTEFLSRFNKPEYYFGVSVKPRGVDFDLFHQSEEAENCYGPFNDSKLSGLKEQGSLFQIFLDTSRSLAGAGEVGFRLMFYIGERDLGVHGYSDDLILNSPRYIRTIRVGSSAHELKLQYYDDTIQVDDWQDCIRKDDHWEFSLNNPYFSGRFAIEIAEI